MVPAAALGGNAGPTRSLFDPLSTAEQGFPTQSVVQGFLDLNHSSSSSHVWKLGIEGLCAAQESNGPVGRLWVVSASPVSTRGHLDGCAPPPVVVHLLSPVCPCWIPRSSRRRARLRRGPVPRRACVVASRTAYTQVSSVSRGVRAVPGRPSVG